MFDMTLWMWVGFLLAAYSVVANDSVQTLGTWIASNHHKRDWRILWVSASLVLLWAIWYGWFAYSGDISYGRLNSIPFVDIKWYHAMAPGVLLLLTRFGVPVSTSFLVLSAFASSVVMEQMLIKSALGYAIAAVCAYIIWQVVARLIDERKPIEGRHHNLWVTAQWASTGLLWWTWLSHDLANVAVFLPRALPVDVLIMVSVVFVVSLGFMFREGGGSIQNIVLEKHSTKYVRSATMIDLFYWLVLLFFKELNDIPMSTTWVFVGLLTGRELAIATVMNTKMKRVFPLVFKDFSRMMLGLIASVAIVLAIQYLAT